MHEYRPSSGSDRDRDRVRARSSRGTSRCSGASAGRPAHRRLISVRGALALWLLAGLPVAAQQAAPRKLGGEIPVNTYTPSSQAFPVVESEPTGNFVVVWRGAPNSDIYQRRFDAIGPVSGEERVNSYTTNFQGFPAVALDDDGDFVVAWNSSGPEGPGAQYGIAAQRFDALGAPRGPELLVNTYTPNNQVSADIGRAGGGEFVVAWESGIGGQDDIRAQRFDASGSPVGGEFQANAYGTTNDQERPAVAVAQNGNFTIVWDHELSGVYFRQFSSNGYPLSYSNTKVNSIPSGNHWSADIGMADAGDFVVAWHRSFDGDTYGIYMRRFDSSGNALSNDDELVNTHTTAAQFRPAVDMSGSGEFVVVWESNGQDGTSNGVFGQAFDAGGNRLGGEFQVNTTTVDSEYYADVAIDDAGNFVVVWHSFDSGTGNTDTYLQRFLGPCRSELPLVEDKWHLISLPCLPPAGGETVQAVFGDDLPLNGYGGSWVLFERDAAADQYVQLALTDTLEMGRGYWIFTILTNRTIDVEGSNADYSCAPGSFFAAKGGCHVSPVLTGAGGGDCGDLVNLPGRFNMLGHPLTRDIGWAGTRFHDNGTEYTVQDAQTQNIASDQIWTWNGSAYQAGDACTMGMEATLTEWDGFWTHVCSPATPLTLRIGGSETTSCTTPPPPPFEPEGETSFDSATRELGTGEGSREDDRGAARPAEKIDENWYLRLVASADGLTDPGNVLGELADSVLGYDSHDLIELQPFGTNWLTIVFPHLDWGAASSEWYTSDYHGPKDPREWSFEVRSNQARTVTLTWELTGEPKHAGWMGLVDEVSGATVPLESGSYTFTMSGTEHPFSWRESKGGGPPHRR